MRCARAEGRGHRVLLGTSWWPVHTHNWALADWLMHREEEEWEEERDTGEGVRRGGTSHSAHTYILQAASQPPPPPTQPLRHISWSPLCSPPLGHSPHQPRGSWPSSPAPRGELPAGPRLPFCTSRRPAEASGQQLGRGHLLTTPSTLVLLML